MLRWAYLLGFGEDMGIACARLARLNKRMLFFVPDQRRIVEAYGFVPCVVDTIAVLLFDELTRCTQQARLRVRRAIGVDPMQDRVLIVFASPTHSVVGRDMENHAPRFTKRADALSEEQAIIVNETVLLVD